MTDHIILPRSVLTNELTHDHDLSRLLLYLLSKAFDNGNVEYDTAELTKEFGWSAQQSEVQISRLKRIWPFPDPSPEAALALPIDDITSFADIFNNKVKYTSIPQIRGLTETRKRAVRNLVKEHGGIVALESILDKVIASDFLSGRKTDFCATFDWIFKKANFIKILEGNYDNKPLPSVRDTPATRKAQRDRGLSLANQIVSGSENLLSLYNGDSEDPDACED